MWLTLENEKFEKIIINEIESVLYGIHYRLVYTLIKEFDNIILFRYSCAANDPCNHVLIDKSNGTIIKKFGELISISDEIKDYENNFIIYYSEDYNHIIVNFIDIGKKLKIPFNDYLKYTLIREYNFYEMRLDNNLIELEYENENSEIKIFQIDLNDKKYIVN